MKITRKEIIKRLDVLRQTYARYDGAKLKGGEYYNTCVSCGATHSIKKIQGGHFIGRACYPLRWDEKNVNPQCQRCNMFLSGNYIEYSKWFIDKYGVETFDLYVEKGRKWRQGKLPAYKLHELKELYDHWLAKGWELEEQVGILFPKSWEPFGPEYML